jgi:hypothetical protein
MLSHITIVHLFHTIMKPVQYEGESVNISQMDITSKTCNIRTSEKHLFLDIPSTNINTTVPSLY